MLFRTITIGLLICLSATSVNAQKWGSVKGQFVFNGTPPIAANLQITKDANFCGKAENLVDEEVVVDPKSKGVMNVVTSVYLKRNGKIDTHPDYAKTANDKVKVDNKNCRFEPHVVLLRTTQTLEIGNSDSVGHNSMVSPFGQDGINPMIPAGKSIEATFKKSESVPAKIQCSIHPWMMGHVVIKDHPYMSVSDKDGKFELKNLPVGSHTLEFWHETGRLVEIDLGGKKEKLKKGQYKVTIKEGMNDLGVIKLAPAEFKTK